ncbi:MAG: DNA polymerase IV [Melioribacteraceae bacterium]|nr:DNA polymerase IV [Melioribacteraceae bacterium]
MPRIIFHLDLDAFFVSVERILDPSLKGKPVIVGGDPKGRGVVAACSYEAREFGLHSAMPIKQAYRLCPQGIYIHGSLKEYSRFSKGVKKILEDYAPMIEQASIDEFYMDFTGTQKIYGSMIMLGNKIQSEIKRLLGLPSSIGIAGNKTLAKIASDAMKPEGITYIYPGMEKEFLANMPIQVIPGVGRVTLKNLNAKGFFFIKDITKVSQDYFAAAYGKHGIELWEKANGKGNEYLNPPQERKSISKERTFGNDLIDKNEIEETLFGLTEKVCQLLRDRNWLTSTVSIKLRYSDFQTLTRAKSIKATDDDKLIFDTAKALFKKAYTRRVGIRLIGIHLSNFSEFSDQEFLFEDAEIKRNKMFKAITKIRDKYGFTSINYGKNSE